MATPARKPTQSVPDWQRLQRKIFTRWVNQKLIKRQIAVADIVTDIQTGLVLVALLEELSEKTCPHKMDKNPKMKPNKIDNLSQALKFVWECGIDMKVKPSAEQLHDGDETAILGLIWAIMSKYMKIGDDDEGPQLSAKEALLMWCQNKTKDYPSVKIEKFGKEWHDGLALCALIHKHRPKLIPWETLNKDNKEANLKLAMDAAEKYFGLEKYLTPDEVTKLDENSMVVYVSEYYYGIAEQRKLDLAAKRIQKVIKLTIENDAMKKQYNETSQAFKERVQRVEKILEDRSIDNTMAGAKRRIEEFYDYKLKDKNVLLSNQLDLEALYNNLAMKLSYHKRPEFVPPAGLTLKDIAATVHHLEECEQERKVALHNELNRQIKLVQLDGQHQGRYQQVKVWGEEKARYLKTRETIESVSAAELQLRLFETFTAELKNMQENNGAQLTKLGDELRSEKYERSSEVTARDTEIKNLFTTLATLATEKRPVLDDALAREKFKEEIRGMNEEHINNHVKLTKWLDEKQAYLETREEVHSVSEARTQLSLFDSYTKEKASTVETDVAELNQLGKEVLAAKYSTTYSNWSIENPEALRAREAQVAQHLATLDELAAEKKRVLDDHLAREEFAEKVRMMNRNHLDRHDKLQKWITEKLQYLTTEEVSTTVAEARTQLARLAAYDKEKQRSTDLHVSALKKLGAATLAEKYQTTYSSYTFEHPEAITQREAAVDQQWKVLDSKRDAKKAVLEADLARELEKERLRMEFARLASNFARYTKDTAEEVAVSHFGFSLEEVEAYQATLNKSNAAIQSSVQTQTNDYKSIQSQMVKMNVTDNVYTSLTLADLEASQRQLDQALKTRDEAYAKELARQRYNDSLCKQFAGLADPFVAALNGDKDKITSSKQDLEEQLKFVQSKVAGLPSQASQIPPINDLHAKMEAAGITNNRYTTLTAKDVTVQYEQYQSFLTKKATMLEEEIEHHKLRGVTPEQFKEIETQFRQFDEDNSGFIDKKELKALLYSLGEEKNRAEVDQIMTKYGSKDVNGMRYESFKQFMIDLLGVSVTKDDINNSFFLISRGNEAVITVDKMDILMDEPDVNYIKTTAPATSGGYDYRAWTEDVFSR